MVGDDMVEIMVGILLNDHVPCAAYPVHIERLALVIPHDATPERLLRESSFGPLIHILLTFGVTSRALTADLRVALPY